MMRSWHDFLDSLDSDGGHIIVLLALIVIGAVAFRHGFPKAEDVIMGAFGALLLMLKAAGSNREHRETSVAAAVVENSNQTKEDNG
jgi:hypothetical protein